jgi:two-component system, NarL family, nitrate/nitrite response regulator NarL
MAMRVMLVDDHIMFREGIKNLLSAEPDFDVVGDASTVEEAVDKAQQLNPDLILMDLNLPDGTGLEAVKAILGKQPSISVVILTILVTDRLLLDAVRAGVKGFILKNLSISKLLAALRGVQRGEAALSRTMTAQIINEFHRINTRVEPEPDEFSNLTRRELDVLALLVQGQTNSEIAQQLSISENTVKNHIHNILDKMGVKSRSQAARLACRYNLVTR